MTVTSGNTVGIAACHSRIVTLLATLTIWTSMTEKSLWKNQAMMQSTDGQGLTRKAVVM